MTACDGTEVTVVALPTRPGHMRPEAKGSRRMLIVTRPPAAWVRVEGPT